MLKMELNLVLNETNSKLFLKIIKLGDFRNLNFLFQHQNEGSFWNQQLNNISLNSKPKANVSYI